MKKFLSLLLAVCTVLPLLAVFSTLAVSAAVPVYDKPAHTSVTDASAGLTIDGTVDHNKTCADDNYRTKKEYEQTPHTFQTWVYIPQSYASKEVGVLLGNQTAANDTRGAYMTVGILSGRVPAINYYNDLLVDHEVKFEKSVIPTEKWTLLTIVWNGESGIVSCYLNGTLSEQVYFLPDLSASAFQLPLMLGGDARMMNTNYFKGAMQDTTLYVTARTAAQVKADYQNGVNVNDPELLCHYDFDAADKGKDIPDRSGNGYDLQYSKTWLTEEEMNAIRASYTFTPSYSFAIIGDIQKSTYRDAVTNGVTTPNASNSSIYRMYQWLAQNKTNKNIKMVIGMGDITDANFAPEWALVKASIAQLDAAGLPYTLVRGNHDSYTATKEGYTGLGDTGFDTYFDKNSDYYKQVAATGGFYNTNSVRNTYRRLEVGGTKWLIISLDVYASNDVVTWASNLCSTYSDHQVVITTHIYLGAEGYPIESGGLSDSPNNGDDKWTKLAEKHENVVMVLSGHIGSERLVTTQVEGKNGNTVTQMLIDPQDSDGGLGGLGYVLLYHFNADGSEFYTEFYSVERDRYLLTENQFHVDLNATPTKQKILGWDVLKGEKPSGSGTESDPYRISHPAHLAWMAYQVEYNDHKVHFTNTYFKQVCDIDLQGYVIQSIGGYFKLATGNSADLNAKAFGGYYDGGGFVIKNGTLTACHPDKSFNKRKNFGLFGTIYGATIENVILENMCITGRGPTGAIVGKAMAPWDGSAEVGFNKIIGCRVGADVDIRVWHPVPSTSNKYDDGYKAGVVGSICGIAYATEIRGCNAANVITASGLCGMIGGIAGTAGYNTVIDHCAFTGGIELVDTSYVASVSIGGITGAYSPSGSNDSFPDIEESNKFMKGFLNITNCYNSGYYVYTGSVNITTVDKTNGHNVNNKNIHWGGILGHAGGMMAITPTEDVPYPYLIENCYNLYSEQRGTLEKSTDRYVSGGIVGRSTASKSVENPFWLKNCYSVEVDAGGLSTATSTNLYRCDATGVTSLGLPAVQVLPDSSGNSTVGTRTLEQMQGAVMSIDVGILRIQSQKENVATVWHTGRGVPTSSANTGDLYLDIETGNVYVYVEREINTVYPYAEWMPLTNIKGASGADGTNGTDGTNGNRWYTGRVTPSITDAIAGDMYLNTANGNVYRYTGTAWSLIGNLTGPQGESGQTGPQGPKGKDGADGADGANAAASSQSNTGNADASNVTMLQVKAGNTATVALIVAAVAVLGNIVLAVLLIKKKKA